MAFDATPSQLWRNIFWNITYEDLKTKVRLFLGEKQAMIAQGFQSLYKVAELALGDGSSSGGKSGSKLPADAEVYKPKSAEELQQAMYKVFQ